MDSPYEVCCIERCTGFADGGGHHEPLRNNLNNEHRDLPKFKRPLCRTHHNERHAIGYDRFKAKHPSYDGVSLTGYRQWKMKTRRILC